VDKRPSRSFALIYGVVLLLALAMAAGGIWLAVQVPHSWVLLAAGGASLIAVLLAWPLATQLRLLYVDNRDRSERALTSINERFEQFSVMLNLISEQQLLSDRAKSVAFREKDSDALRRAIQEEILKQDWEAATSLANEMEKGFGYKQEADRLRNQISEKHNELIRRHITEAMAAIDRYARAEAWPDAFREAQRVAGQFPDSTMAQSLPAEVENRRQAQKKQLIDSWNDATARHDVDGAIEILKRLDMYLTPTEGEAFQETARGIFKEKLNILRTQFAVSVQDHNWNEALRLADVITRDFPNTQMAKEVREMMETLRARASGLEPAPV
jgi:hypothetical protein